MNNLQQLQIFIIIAFTDCFSESLTKGRLPGHGTLRTSNVDDQFGKWNKVAGVPYCLDANYTAAEVDVINKAISIMKKAMYCIKWTPVNCSDSKFKVRFTPLKGGPGSDPQTVSFSYPGLNVKPYQNNAPEQIMSIARDSLNCSMQPRCVLKMLAILLGLRNEHQRGDRDKYIELLNDNLLIPAAYRLYVSQEAYWENFPYDFCSITHNQPGDYANPGTLAFRIRPNTLPGCIPPLETISNTDCRILSTLYNCDPYMCATLNCSAQVCPATTIPPPTVSTASTYVTTAVTTTTATPTTTELPDVLCSVDFCADPPPILDEASILYNDKYFLFSGNCAVEIDGTNKIIGKSIRIEMVLPNVIGPVAAVWTDQYTHITNVLTKAGTQYACSGNGCIRATVKKDNDDLEFEWADSPQGPYTSYRYNRESRQYVNVMTQMPTPQFFINCPDVCSITGAWTAAYLVKGNGTNFVNIIGMDSNSAQVLLILKKSENANDAFDASNNGILLSQALQCSSKASGL
ncbi:uncharacterized protein LOC129588525 [Paramacrobiotus metropolitanus]|uniref:uncharacterized protein LOC129588525 n=1 Tax=Paramacrobiotus metropolitanus TaxID=2943436 RepID=UPI002445875E|nr:uncharacterized protein LOC129588525 [Paramacrobiotus metropolitanus]